MKVLLAVDGSEFSRLAERMLHLAPGVAGAEVTVATVVPPLHIPLAGIQPFGTAAIGEQAREIDAISRAQAQKVVDQASERLTRAGFKALPTVLEGDIAHELLTLAEDSDADLIAVGSRGLGAVQTFFLGSVARRIVSNASCSVLVAHPYFHRPPADSLADLEAKSRLRVVVGVDGTAGAATAMDWVMRAGGRSLERVCAVCAEPLSVMPAGIDPMAFGALYDHDRERVIEIAKSAAEKLAAAADEADWFTDLGRPVDVLTEAAEREKADLLVIGATRHGAIERFLIGSVSYEVAVRAPCSVLVVRPKQPAA